MNTYVLAVDLLVLLLIFILIVGRISHPKKGSPNAPAHYDSSAHAAAGNHGLNAQASPKY